MSKLRRSPSPRGRSMREPSPSPRPLKPMHTTRLHPWRIVLCLVVVITILLWLLATFPHVLRFLRHLPLKSPNSALESSITCPGYRASNIKTTTANITADLKLAGPACNVYGTDLLDLKLEVTYETSERSAIGGEVIRC